MERWLLAALLVCAGSATQAAAPRPPKELAPLRAALVKAVEAKNWNAVAALTHWPLAVESYQAPPRIERAGFLKNRRALYAYFFDGDKDLLRCIAAAPIAFQGDKAQFGSGDWIVDCNGNEYLFGRRGGKWLFTGYQNINE